MNEIRELLVGYEQAPSVVVVLFNLVYCIFFGFLLRYFYLRHSTLLVAHNHIANILPMLSTIVFFVILIVKSSIALSLGLVGALSIVRFRTPIKEPEELIYLFYAIAIGLGFGSGQSFLTVVVLISSFLIFGFLNNKKNSNNSHNEFNLAINWKKTEASVQVVSQKIEELSDSYRIVKISIDADDVSALVLMEGVSDNTIDNIHKEIARVAPSASISIHEQLVNW